MRYIAAMSLSRLRHLTARAKEWDARERDWSKRNRSRDGTSDLTYKYFSLVRAAGLVLLIAVAVIVSAFHVKLDMVTLTSTMIQGCLLLINPCRLCSAVASFARATRRLAALDLPSIARERRSASATARATAAIEAGALTHIGLARQAAHRLVAHLRAAVGTTQPTSHPRLAASLAAAAAAPQRS